MGKLALFPRIRLFLLPGTPVPFVPENSRIDIHLTD